VTCKNAFIYTPDNIKELAPIMFLIGLNIENISIDRATPGATGRARLSMAPDALASWMRRAGVRGNRRYS
jgi:hypothetical protein